MSIDDEALARLRSLLAKATPGPWRLHIEPATEWEGAVTAVTAAAIGDDFPVDSAICCNTRYYPTDVTPDNQALIAAMHEALPALLDIAEAVARAPVGKVHEVARFDVGGDFVEVELTENYAGKERDVVRIVPCTGGAE